MITNVIAIIAILVTVSSAAWYKTLREVREEVKHSSELSSLTHAEPARSASNMLTASANAIYVSGQTPGATTTVNSLLLEAPGFAAVHEDNKGEPGAVIGVSALLPGGESKNISISLVRDAVLGETMWVMLHLDNGDKKFSADKDKPVLDQLKNPVMMMVAVEAKTEGEAGKHPPEISL